MIVMVVVVVVVVVVVAVVVVVVVVVMVVVVSQVPAVCRARFDPIIQSLIFHYCFFNCICLFSYFPFWCFIVCAKSSNAIAAALAS